MQVGYKKESLQNNPRMFSRENSFLVANWDLMWMQIQTTLKNVPCFIFYHPDIFISAIALLPYLFSPVPRPPRTAANGRFYRLFCSNLPEIQDLSEPGGGGLQ